MFYKNDLVKKGEAVDLFYHSAFPLGSDTPEDHGKTFGEVPNFVAFFEQAKGKAPSGPMFEAYKWFAAHHIWAMWMMLPSGTPDAVVAAIRKAYAANWADKRTVANFSKATNSAPFWLAGEKAGALLSGYTKIGAEAKAYLNSIIR